MHDSIFVRILYARLEACMQDCMLVCKIGGLYARLEACMQDWKLVCKTGGLYQDLKFVRQTEICVQTSNMSSKLTRLGDKPAAGPNSFVKRDDIQNQIQMYIYI